MRAALLTAVLFLLVACGSPETGSQPSATTPLATSTPLAAGSVEAKVAQALSQQVGVGVDTLQLQAKEAQEWPDGSLGCPDPEQMYTQAIVPGFKLTFSDGAKSYEVHTDQQGNQAVLCENSKPTQLGGAGGSR